LALYFPVAIVGFIVFGNELNGNDTILKTLSLFVGKSGNVFIIIAEFLFTLHFVCAIPIFLTPCLNTFNLYLKSKDFDVSDRLTRIVVCLVIIVVALFFPYFTDVMSIVSDLSTSLAAMILPPLFYWKLLNPPLGEKIWLIIIVLFGVAASVIGIYSAVDDLQKNIEKNPLSNFFREIFNFDMSKCNGTSV